MRPEQRLDLLQLIHRFLLVAIEIGGEHNLFYLENFRQIPHAQYRAARLPHHFFGVGANHDL